MNLAEVLERLTATSTADLKRIEEAVKPLATATKWVPNPGPQTEAYNSEADVLLYGGEPGGGKTQLLLGLAQRGRDGILARIDLAAGKGDLPGLIAHPSGTLGEDNLRIIRHVGHRNQYCGRGGAAVSCEMRITEQIGNGARVAFCKEAGKRLVEAGAGRVAHGSSAKSVP